MVTEFITRQVFALQSIYGFGTAFTIIVDRKQYLVTARHVVQPDDNAAIAPDTELEIKQGNRWHSLTCRLVGERAQDMDVAVFAVPQLLTPVFPDSIASGGGIPYGQDAYFLGFPFAWDGGALPLNGLFPFPYIKRALFSMLGNPAHRIVLDGINNKGFSGGPVVFLNEEKKWQVAGVITGSTTSTCPVLEGDSETPTPYTVQLDSGLIDACSINVVLELIAGNPIGPRFDS